MKQKKARYWLRTSGLQWQEATEEQFIQAERTAGFFPKSGCGVATGGFNSGALKGRVTYGKITKKNYGWDPDFLKVAKQGDKQ